MPRDRLGPTRSVEVAARRAEVLRLYAAGYSVDQIAQRMGMTEAAVRSDKHRALQQYIDAQRAPIEEIRAREAAALDRAQQVVTEVMERRHVRVNNGDIVKIIHPDGTEEIIYDDGPNLAAAAKVKEISESRRKLLGADAPSKVEAQVGGTVGYVMKVSQEEMDAL